MSVPGPLLPLSYRIFRREHDASYGVQNGNVTPKRETIFIGKMDFC